jgi:hypothetical protein
MQTFIITDPNNLENPVMELQGNDSLIYHGTHSIACPLIEQKGFCFDSFKEIHGTDIQTIVEACETLYLHPDGYAAAKGFSDHHWVFFSASFKLARSYAANKGGERIDGAIRAAKGFLAFARDQNRVELQAAHWGKVLDEHGYHFDTAQVLANLQNSDLVRELTAKVENAYNVLSFATGQALPVVYAVRSDQKWVTVDEIQDVYDNYKLESMGGITLQSVPADRIVARVDYPNGISPDTQFLFY